MLRAVKRDRITAKAILLSSCYPQHPNPEFSALLTKPPDDLLCAGTLKKGKAAKQSLELLSRGQDTGQRERELLRGVPDMEMINSMVGTVKISMPGLAKLKQNEKKSKKAKAKKGG